jgi:hypothetical protein
VTEQATPELAADGRLTPGERDDFLQVCTLFKRFCANP